MWRTHLRALAVLMLALVMLGGCTRKKDAPAEQDDPPEPAELDLWAGVPPLEPEADDIAEELVPRPGPQKPEQVGEEIELPFPPPVPETPSEGEGDDVGDDEGESSDGPLEVLRRGPDGEQRLIEAIRVSFNHPMVPLASIEDLRARTAPMQIEPEIPGEFRWMGTRTLAFYPEGRLPYSTDYTITIPAGTRSTQGTELRKPVSWTISTPTLALDRSVPRDDGATHVRLDQPLVLRFNQPVDAAAIAEALRLTGGGGRVALELVAPDRWEDAGVDSWIESWATGGDQEWERSRVVVLRPVDELAPAKKYTVELPRGVYGEGPERSDAIRFSFRTYPPLKLSRHRCHPSPCSASYGLRLDASNRLRDARVVDKVHVSPEVEGLAIHQAWNGIRIDGDFVGNQTYALTVDAGLEDVYGQELGKPFSTKIKLGPLEPSLQVWPRANEPGIIEAQAGHTLELRVAGLRELEIIGVSFNSAELGDFNGFRSYEDDWPSALPEPTLRKAVDVSASRERVQTITVDVDEFVEGTDTFVYLFVRSEPVKRYGWTERLTLRQIVQVTNLGLTAAFDRDDAVVLVTDLASGEPVPRAEVRVLADHGAREIWKGRADDQGVARPKLGHHPFDAPVLVARKLDDEVFLPLNRSDLEGRWVAGLFGQPHEEQIDAFIFTEREPYKPGETAHLFGVIRRELEGPEGGVVPWGSGAEFDYRVTTPRGVKVDEGKLKVGPFGTFTLDIETDDNGDTGNYSFELSHTGLFGKTRRFSHSFAVEAFRTPEFEVEVAREDSTPLYFGDELEVEIRGRYLFGAPMVGAAVSYTLTRQATDFRPPTEGLGDFHFASTPGRRWGWTSAYWGGGHSPAQQLEAEHRVLDHKGVVTVRHPLAQVEPQKQPVQGPPAPPKAGEQDDPPPQAASFSIDATVTDDNRQAIAGHGSFVVHPAAYYVGLRSERSVLKENERTRVEAAVVDVEGQRIAGVEIDLQVVRKQTTRTPVERDGVWTFDYSTERIETARCELSSDGSPVACEVGVGEAGTYEIVAEIRDPEGRTNRSVIEIYVHGKDAVVWEQDQKRVDLVPDKQRYEPGETAKILVRSPFEQARGFLVVERQGRAQTHALEVEGGMAVVEVEIEPAMVAGVTASAVLTKPRTPVAGVPDEQDLGAPAAASGQIELEVSTDSKAVVVELLPERDRVEPGSKLRVELRTRTAHGAPIPARVALFVVDEGVLNLMGYQTPDPLAFFHHRRAGEVGLYADHPLVLPRNVAEQPRSSARAGQADLPAGDGDVWGGLTGTGTGVGEAYGVGGLGIVGTGRGGGGTGEGSIGLGNTGLIGKGGGGGSGYGRGSGAKLEAKNRRRAQAPLEEAAADEPAPPAAPMAIDANRAMSQAVSLRTLFATTAYFNPEIETDEGGFAAVEIDMPENLTSYRIMAVAVDPIVLDRFGSGEASVRVRKTIMLRPSLPRFLNMGDEFEASVMVDNQSEVRQTVLVGTRGLNVKLLGETETAVEIPAGESREVRFPMAVDRVGTMRLQFAALANDGRDATELELPVHVPATKQAFADYGVTSASVARAVELPKDALPGFGGLELSLSSTALNGLEDAVEYLVTYPYECSEQTASRLLPIFALGKILDDFPIAEVHDRRRRDALAEAGIERLLRRQNWDGGFGYWSADGRGQSWPYVSTWVTLALLEGKQTGYEVDEDQLERALGYLENYVRRGIETRWGVYYDWTSRAFALWLLSREQRGAELFDRVWAKRARMPLYARILLMSAAKRYDRSGPVEVVLAELRNLVVEDAKVVHFTESRTEAAAADGLAVLMHSNTQTDAIALMTLLELDEETGDDGMVAKIMAGLIDDRDPRLGGRWTSTHANAWALLAASRYYERMEAETPDFQARVWLDDLFAAEQQFAGRDMAKVNQRIPMAELLERGVERVTLAKDGPGKLYYRLGLRYAPRDFRMQPVDRGFTVSRRYEAMPEAGEDEPDPEAVVRLDDGSWKIRAGTNVEVTLTLVARDRSSFVVVDDPLPAGFEGQNPRFLTSVAATGEADVDYGYGLGGRRGRGGYDYDYGRASYGWWYPWFSFDHTQMRDDRMLLFADWLPAGVYTYSYTARATNLGTFVLPPVHAEAMYAPERFGHGSSSTVRIVE